MPEALRSTFAALPQLAKFAITLAVFVGIPPLARRVRIPPQVGLILMGVLLGPHVLGVYGESRPTAEFFSELGKLLLLFSIGLEVDVERFRDARFRSIVLGSLTTLLPLAFGAAVALLLGAGVLPALAIGCLVAPHSLVALPSVRDTRAEPVLVTIGATVLSDALALILFGLCVRSFENGFSWSGLGVQVLGIVLLLSLVLVVLARLGARVLDRVRGNEPAHFVVLLGIMATAGLLADAVRLPEIVGAFLAGLAVNGAVRTHPARERVQFLGKTLFIPSFFVVTGFLLDPVEIVTDFGADLRLVLGLLAALVAGKALAAALSGRAFGYARAVRREIFALTLPLSEAAIAAAVVGQHAIDTGGEHMLGGGVLRAVLVILLLTSLAGAWGTQRVEPA
jgi:Kef-type K+ transport system membrane component KefB